MRCDPTARLLEMNARDGSGARRFRGRLYRCRRADDALYYGRLEKHIGRHIALLMGE